MVLNGRNSTISRIEAGSLFRQTPHHVEFVVGRMAVTLAMPVGQREEGPRSRRIPNVVVT